MNRAHSPLILSTLLAAGCTLDADRIEASVKEKLKDQGIEISSIDCPDGRAVKSGDEFECKGKTKDDVEFTVRVTQTQSGGFDWKLVGRVGDLSEYSKEIGGKLGLPLDCGKGKIIAVKGAKFTCQWDGKSAELVFTDDDGNVNADDFGRQFKGEKPAP